MNKQTLSSAIIFIFSIFIFASCDNEAIDPVLASQLSNPATTGGSGGTGGTGGSTGSTSVFKADFNGQTWTATTASANIFNGKIELVGLKGTQDEGFGFSLNGSSAGSYSSSTNLLAYSPASATDSYLGLNPNNPTEIAGSVIINTIDTVNHTISGSFSFKGYWTDYTVSNVAPINFTNGIFTNIPYTSLNPVTDTFFAKADGTEFVENNIDVAATISSGFPDSYSIVGSKSNGDNIGLSIAQSLPVGTYQFTGPFGQQINSSCLFGGVLYNGETGSVTITSKTATHMTGTFNIIVKNFTTNQTKTISEGAFSVDLP
jgi:hypothetical protein